MSPKITSLSFSLLQNFAKWFQNETGEGQLQEIWTNGQVLVFHFYKFKDQYLCIDLAINQPMLAYVEKRPPVAKKQNPTVLFLNAHARNLRLEKAWTQSDAGRVLFLSLVGKTEEGFLDCEIEIRLIPNAVNVLVRAQGKKISWSKPRELPPSIAPLEMAEPQVNWKELGEKWLEEKFARRSSEQRVVGTAVDPRLKVIEKKKKAIAEIEKKLSENLGVMWSELGESLKVSAKVPDHLSKLYDGRKSRSWNLENAFRQTKLLLGKRKGTLERLEILKSEIAILEEKLLTPYQPQEIQSKNSSGQPTASQRALKNLDVKVRRLPLDEGVEAFIGKSARDNLALLRRAQAWDYWLHLKDYPGAHAIILRPRHKEIGPEHIQKVSQWLIDESLSKEEAKMGGRYEVVVAEVRHVRPIKGDKLGRVTYHYPKVFSFASKT